MQGSITRGFALTIIVAAAALLTGCQDKLSHKNFTLIQQNFSTQHEVTMLIGEPTEQAGSRWTYERPDKHLFAFVDFSDEGVVSRTQWVDAQTATWEDSQPDPEGQSSRQTIHRVDGSD